MAVVLAAGLVTAAPPAAAPSAAAADPAPAAERDLFAPPTRPFKLPPAAPWELRHRRVSVNWDLLRPLCDPAGRVSPDTVTLNLFPDVRLTAEADQVGLNWLGTGLRWRGEMPGVEGSSVTLTAFGLCAPRPRKLTLAGSVNVNGEEFTIRPGPFGETVITEIDSTAAGMLQKPARPPKGTRTRDEHADTATGPAGGGTAQTDTGTAPADGGAAPADGGAAPGGEPSDRVAAAAANGPAVIDALILYTPGAVREAGGKEEIEAWIDDAANRANDNLHDSGVRASFRVAHMREATGYRGKETVTPAFDHLSKPKDGSLDEAAALREKMGADIVTTVVRGYDPKDMVAGLASYPEKPRNPQTSDQVWSVVAANQLWAYILAHEWGHLLGLEHDWTTAPEKNPYLPDNHGYVSGSDSFVTIMGYPSACSPPCPYIGYYANPRLKYDGENLGVTLGEGPRSADNTRVMNVTAPQVGAYRAAKTGRPDRDLRIEVTPEGAGAAAAETTGPYNANDSVSVSSDPAPGHVLAGWTLDGRPAGKADPFTVTMDRDHTLTARFVKGREPRHRLTTQVSPPAAGSIESTPPGPAYDPGARIIARARPGAGHVFAGWELDGGQAGDDDVLDIDMSRDHRLVARFAPAEQLTVTIQPGAGGDVSFDDSHASNTDVVATARPARGWAFRGWILGGRRLGSSPSMVFNVSGGQHLTALFGPAARPPNRGAHKPAAKQKPAKKHPKKHKKPKKHKGHKKRHNRGPRR